MNKRSKKPNKSDRPKMVLAIVLAVVLAILLLRQFGGPSSSDLTAVGTSDLLAINSPNSRARRDPENSNTSTTGSASASSIADNQSPANPSAATQRRSNPSRSLATQPPRSNNSGPSTAKDSQKLPEVQFAELPRLPHDFIAATNPFLNEVDIPDAGLLDDPENASSASVIASTESTPEPQIRAVLMTAEGATALIDGQLVPIQNPRPAIDAIKSNWGNDFSQSTNATEN